MLLPRGRMAYITRVDVRTDEKREVYDGICTVRYAKEYRTGYRFNCIEIHALNDDGEISIWLPSETIIKLAEMIKNESN